jgi:hypothetical protein
MPDRLSLRPALLMVALAFGVAVVSSALLSGGSSAARPAAKQSAPRVVTDAPGAEPDLSLAATKAVPALRDPRQPRKRRAPARTKASARKVVNAAPKVTPAPPVSPMPIATPRYVPPAPRRSTPAPKPKPKPAPTSTPQGSGEFDSSGEP